MVLPLWATLAGAALMLALACGGSSGGSASPTSGRPDTGVPSPAGNPPVGNGVAPGGAKTTRSMPAPGNPAGTAAIPAAAQAEDVSHPTTVVGTGTPESCTPAALEAAIHKGGVVTFNGGPDPITITLDHTIKIINNAGASQNGDLVIDGGGKVTLSGGERCRILYQNGCDAAQVYITDHCQDYPHPRLVLQNLILADGYATDGGIMGGGALFVESGSLKLVNCVFVNNQCALTGRDVAGGAVYAFMVQGPVYITNCTFGGVEGMGNRGSHGGALGTIGVSYTILNSRFSWNRATGTGMNGGTPGGGNGGAIYNDGNTYTLDIQGCDFSNNAANELAGAVFYVSNDSSGALKVDHSTFHVNSGKDVQSVKGFYIQAGSQSFTTCTFD